MYQVRAELTRPDAERLSDLLMQLDPSPVSATATEEISRVAWSLDAFCETESQAEGVASIIAHECPSASPIVRKIEDRDWVAVSLEGLPPVHAGPFVVAGAHALAEVFERRSLARRGGGKIPVWIEAGPAFGTGHHGTTKGCLEALAPLLRAGASGKRPRRILDLGAGSGVLAIAAIKAGVERAVASDLDGESVRIARENARNNKTGRRITFVHAAGATSTAIRGGAPYDLVLANILARPLVSLAPELARLVRPGGRIILSGLLTRQEPQVRAAYGGRGLLLERRKRLNGWSTLVYVRSPLALPVGAAVAQSERSKRQKYNNRPQSASTRC